MLDVEYMYLSQKADSKLNLARAKSEYVSRKLKYVWVIKIRLDDETLKQKIVWSGILELWKSRGIEIKVEKRMWFKCTLNIRKGRANLVFFSTIQTSEVSH